jgi:hypothetical protein
MPSSQGKIQEALRRFVTIAVREDLGFHGFQQLEAGSRAAPGPFGNARGLSSTCRSRPVSRRTFANAAIGCTDRFERDYTAAWGTCTNRSRRGQWQINIEHGENIGIMRL